MVLHPPRMETPHFAISTKSYHYQSLISLTLTLRWEFEDYLKRSPRHSASLFKILSPVPNCSLKTDLYK